MYRSIITTHTNDQILFSTQLTSLYVVEVSIESGVFDAVSNYVAT